MLGILKAKYGFKLEKISELIIKDELTVYEVLKKKHIYEVQKLAAIKI